MIVANEVNEKLDSERVLISSRNDAVALNTVDTVTIENKE